MSQTASTIVGSPQATIDIATLPDGWQLVALGELCDFQGGTQPPKSTFKSKPQTGYVRLLQIQDFKTDAYAVYVPDDAKLNKCDATDVLIGRYGASVGRILRGKAGAYNVAIVKTIPDLRAISKDYLFYVLNGADFQSLIRDVSARAAQAGFNKNDVSSLKIPLPPLPEQKRIAAILNEQMAAFERARAAAEAQLKAAKDLPAAYMRAVFNSPEANEWDKRRLGEVCEIVARQVDPKSPEYGVLPHVNGENIESGTCRLKFLRTAAEDNMTSGKYLFEVGDVLYSKLRPYLRKAMVADFRGVCSADMYPIRVNPDFLSPHFTAWMLVSDEFTKYADEESRRARMPKLNREQLFAWEAPLPPLTMQEIIIETLSEQMARAENIAIKLQEQLDSINKLPAALLRQAFTGKL